ncbi:hypothetical protein XENTR_v10004147 [Xenopus tropicalis]|nr:hypothetical protein XENTR_v10004147 [Xenopus tropicalis]
MPVLRVKHQPAGQEAVNVDNWQAPDKRAHPCLPLMSRVQSLLLIDSCAMRVSYALKEKFIEHTLSL